jgi:histidinol dehydrogenase
MKKIFYPSVDQWDELLARPVMSLDEIEQRVLPIMHRVKTEGDAALISFAKTFDGVDLENLEVTEEEWSHAENQIDEDLKAAIKVAAQNIREISRLTKTR